MAETSDEAVQRQLEELRSMRHHLEQQSQEFDQRIQQLETELYGDAPPVASRPGDNPGISLGYRPGKGFNLFNSDMGEVNFGGLRYTRRPCHFNGVNVPYSRHGWLQGC